jgi:hypothetical protein
MVHLCLDNWASVNFTTSNYMGIQGCSWLVNALEAVLEVPPVISK